MGTLRNFGGSCFQIHHNGGITGQKRYIFLVILLLMQEVREWLIILGSGSLVGCED
jgi:hypothetical protein